MPDLPISGLPAASSITATDLFVVDVAGITQKVTGIQVGHAGLPIWDYGGMVWNILAAGAKNDAKTVADGAITTGTPTLTSATAGFTAADTGKTFGVVGAGAAGAVLVATGTFVNSTTITLSINAGTTVSGKGVCWGTDNSALINNALTTAGTTAALVFPDGGYLHSTNSIRPLDKQTIQGGGSNSTTFYPMGLNLGSGENEGIRVPAPWNGYYSGLNLCDFGVDGTWMRGTAAGMTLQGIHNLILERFQIKNTNGFGIYLASISSGGVLGLGTHWTHARIRDGYITNSRLNDNFGGGGGTDCIFDRCWSDAPVTNGFDLTNMNDVWFLACRVTSTAGTPTAFATDFGMQGGHYVDCVASGVGIQYGFTATGDPGNASAQGATTDLFYTGCHVAGIAVNPFWLKAAGAGRAISRVQIVGCDINSTAAAGIYSQGTVDLVIVGNNFRVGAAQYAVSLDSEAGGAAGINTIVQDNNMAGTLGTQVIAAPTGVSHLQNAAGEHLGPMQWWNLIGTQSIFQLTNTGDAIHSLGNFYITAGFLKLSHDLQRSRQTPTEAVLVSGVNALSGEIISVTLTAARLVGAPLNPFIGQYLTFSLTQGGAGGFAVTWNAVFKKTWADTGNTTGKISAITFFYDGTNWIQTGAQAAYV